MSIWSYSAALRTLFSLLDFFAVYFATLLGRCALWSLPALGLVLALRLALGEGRAFGKGALWALFVPVLFLGRLQIYYTSRFLLPFALWQSWCCGYWWLRWGCLLGVTARLLALLHRQWKLRRELRMLPEERFRGEKIRLCPLCVSPFAAGVLAPVIVVPKQLWKTLDGGERCIILCHERTHIRLGHLWIFLLWDVFRALLWFNPLLHLATPRLREDMEQICDRVAIRRGGDALAYGRLILKCLALLRPDGVRLPAAFIGERDFAAEKRRLRQVRAYLPYARRNVAALGLCTLGLLITVLLCICQASVPRCTDLEGFTVIHFSSDLEYSTLYETKTGRPPLTARGGSAEVDTRALRELLPEDAPADGLYYILWGGFMKLPGIGGALNAIWLDGLDDRPVAEVPFSDVNRQFYIRLARWI